jgi:hypothetical protein
MIRRVVLPVILGLFFCALIVGWIMGRLEPQAASSPSVSTATSPTTAFDRPPATVAPGVTSFPSVALDSGGTGSTDPVTTAQSTSTTLGLSEGTTEPAHVPKQPKLAIAWQPSHQDDTGFNSWHEYRICGDIVKRTMSLLTTHDNVLAWQTGMGLTGSNKYGGSNVKAFDWEVAAANNAHAYLFISVHNNGASPSGVLGMYFIGDHTSAKVAEQLARGICAGTGLPFLGLQGQDLYSLDPGRNKAPIRVLLEIGDNVRDRAFLEDAASRQQIAEALAKTLQSLEVAR